MKKPMLIIGILMMTAFLMDLNNRSDGNSLFFRKKFVPHSCNAVLVMLEKRIPASWNATCEENNLAVEMIYSGPKTDDPKVKQITYRRLANDLAFIAKNSPEETLSRVFIVRIKSLQPGLEINAVTEGKFISKLATLNAPSHISEHLKNTVQIKETIK